MRNGSEPHLTSVVHLLTIPKFFWTKFMNLLKCCIWHAVSLSLSFCTIWILNGWIKPLIVWHLANTPHVCTKDQGMSARWLIWTLQNDVPYPIHILRHMDRMRMSSLESITDPCSCHFDTHNKRVLRAGATCLWNCCWKPYCVAIVKFALIKNSTATFRFCTSQCSIEHCTDKVPSGSKQILLHHLIFWEYWSHP